ncbi:hypothetical protein TanjilG_01795 [Lupinus angustifolius]|uniref:DNA-directed RNA polymerase n=1 Tax=Lupinus angustifolius TaxID=3871 RepID=A0A1J7GZY1_LUPAN|nr:hypothetical protein TanjilG_01795 [Lupinus angustifolius]
MCTASISDSAIIHASQLSNPLLGLPLEFGRCESCGTSEPGKCEEKWIAESNVGADVRQKDSSTSNAWESNSNRSSENPAWGSQNDLNQAANSQGWDLQIAPANSDRDKNFQWGNPNLQKAKHGIPKLSQIRPQVRKDGTHKLLQLILTAIMHCTASISDSAIIHASQLSNPLLGLPLEFGRCESCGTSEPGKCEGHFGYIELPVPIYPSHVNELKWMLSLSIGRIVQQGYNDGDPLSAEYQAFVLENVFEHHTDKETKMGDGIDYVMECKKEDFSYRKCLENLVRKKYPDIAESFIDKHFQKHRGRGVDHAPTTPLPTSTETKQSQQHHGLLLLKQTRLQQLHGLLLLKQTRPQHLHCQLLLKQLSKKLELGS